MKIKHIPLPIFLAALLIVIIFISGCGLLSISPVSQRPEGGSPNTTSTPTPFLPYAPTAVRSNPLFPTATPKHSPTPTIYAIPNTTGGGNSQSPSGQNPGAAQVIEQPPNQINILVLGSDRRAYSGGYRTDVILLVTVNFQLKTINMTSFPRDLYVYLPDSAKSGSIPPKQEEVSR